jgi:hypothetical protein
MTKLGVSSYSSFSRPTAIFVSMGRACAFICAWWAKCIFKQCISLHSSAFCPPGTAECACAALKETKMAVGRENDEYTVILGAILVAVVVIHVMPL